MGLKDVRGAMKAEAAYYRKDNLQACRICGRLFTKRRDDICSMACAERARKAPTEPAGES